MTSSTTPSGPTTTSAPISPLVRTSLIVRDLERSRRFYQDLLGLCEAYLPLCDLTDTIAWQLMGFEQGRPYTGIVLKVPGANNAMVGLFEIGDDYPHAIVPPRDRIAIGETIQVFYCSHLATVLEKLEDFGGHLLAPPRQFFIEGSGMKSPLTEVIVRDPDGYAVSLNDQDPAAAYETGPVSLGPVADRG